MHQSFDPDSPKCPSGDCPACSGAACWKCGAGVSDVKVPHCKRIAEECPFPPCPPVVSRGPAVPEDADAEKLIEDFATVAIDRSKCWVRGDGKRCAEHRQDIEDCRRSDTDARAALKRAMQPRVTHDAMREAVWESHIRKTTLDYPDWCELWAAALKKLEG